MRWYAVHTKPMSEFIAELHLRRAGYQTFTPWIMKEIRHARKTSLVKRGYFTRYMFVGLEDGQGLYNVNKAQGVSTVVYSGNEPLEMPAKIMERIRSRAGEDGLVLKFIQDDRTEHREAATRFNVGDWVPLPAGPAKGLLMEIMKIDTDGQIRLYVEAFGKPVRAVVDAGDLPKRLHPAGGAMPVS